MPSYGKAEFKGKAVESVLGQTLANLKLIVVDDCSIDGSLDIAEGYARKDPRARVITEPKRTNRQTLDPIFSEGPREAAHTEA